MTGMALSWENEKGKEWDYRGCLGGVDVCKRETRGERVEGGWE